MMAFKRLAGGCALVPKASLNKQTIRLTSQVLYVSQPMRNMCYLMPVVDASNVHLFWANEDEAHELVKAHKVTLVRCRRRTVALRAVSGAVPELLELAGRGSALGGSRYSDNSESSDNPQGVWRLRKLARDRTLYNDGVLASLCV